NGTVPRHRTALLPHPGREHSAGPRARRRAASLLPRPPGMMPPMTQRSRTERRLIQLLCGTCDRRQDAVAELRVLVGEVDEAALVALLTHLNMLVLLGGRLRAL